MKASRTPATWPVEDDHQSVLRVWVPALSAPKPKAMKLVLAPVLLVAAPLPNCRLR